MVLNNSEVFRLGTGNGPTETRVVDQVSISLCCEKASNPPANQHPLRFLKLFSSTSRSSQKRNVQQQGKPPYPLHNGQLTSATPLTPSTTFTNTTHPHNNNSQCLSPSPAPPCGNRNFSSAVPPPGTPLQPQKPHPMPHQRRKKRAPQLLARLRKASLACRARRGRRSVALRVGLGMR